MPSIRRSLAAFVALALLSAGSARFLPVYAQGTNVRPDPPVSYTCPMHPEVVEDQKGKCSICKMDLVPIRLDTIFSCPVHSVVQETRQGRCPICRRTLVQVTVAVTYTCPDKPEIDQISRGKCAGGSPMIAKYTPRVHGNHNPQHGGLFFMAPDSWHHLEGTYPEAGLFRVHLYDDYTKPLPAAQVKAVTGRVVTKETFDAATRTTKELASAPLVLAANGQYLEARIENVPLPAQMTLKVKFKPGDQEYRFDFAFPAYSDDRAVVVPTSGVDPSQLAVEIPDDSKAVLALLRQRNQQLRDFLAKSAFADMYVPALQAKDLALALDVRLRELPAARRPAVAAAIKKLVTASWLLDAYGDQGNKTQIADAYAVFSEAYAVVERAFAPPAPPAKPKAR